MLLSIAERERERERESDLRKNIIIKVRIPTVCYSKYDQQIVNIKIANPILYDRM